MIIANALYSCQFGTFLCNSELQRVNNDLANTTTSLWSVINQRYVEFLNPLYDKQQTHLDVLLPLTDVRDMQLWRGYYLRYHLPPRQDSIKPHLQVAAEMKQERDLLLRQVDELNSKIRSLQSAVHGGNNSDSSNCSSRIAAES